MTATFTQPTKNSVSLANQTKNVVVSISNVAKHLSTTTTSFLLLQTAFSLLTQTGGAILLESTVPSGTGWSNASKS